MAMAVQLELEVRELAPQVDALVRPTRQGAALTAQQAERLVAMVDRLSFIRRLAALGRWPNLLVLTEAAQALVPAEVPLPARDATS